MIKRTFWFVLPLAGLFLLWGCQVSPPATSPPTPAPMATPSPAAEEHQEAEVHGEAEHAGAGLAIMREAGCLACHRTNGEGGEVGPSLVGIYGTMRELADGEKVVANEEYLHRSMDDPNAQVVKGFAPGIMPSFEGKLSHQDIEAIVHYLKELK